MIVNMYRSVLILLYVWINCPRLYGQPNNATERVLSRHRRYLLFPEGASLQLVYDHTIPISYSQTLFVFATTAAVAWMLPSDIESIKGSFLYDKFNKGNNNERVDKYKTKIKAKPQYETEFYQPQKPYQQYSNAYSQYNKYNDFTRYKPYRPQSNYIQFNKPIRYQTIEHSPSYQQSIRRKEYYRPYNHVNRNQATDFAVRPVTTYTNPAHNYYHRRTGRDLFGKIERFIKAQRKDGRSCVLKIICEVNESNAEKKGSFSEEIIKAIFRFNRSHDGEGDIYDQAASGLKNCSETFPCNFSIWDVI